MFSRTATGLIAAAPTGVVTSGLPVVSGLALAVVAAELAGAPPEGLIPGASAVLMADVVPSTGFDTGVGPEAGLAAEVLAGFAVVFATAGPAVELRTEADAGFGAGGAGLAPEVVGGAGFELEVASDVVFAVEVLAGLAAAFEAAAVPTAELGADDDTGLDTVAAGLAAAVVGDADFDADVASGLAFAVEVLAGLAVAFVAAAAPTAELGADDDTGLDTVAAGLAVDVVAGAAFEVCALGAAVSAGAAWLVGGVFAPAAGLAGAD